MKKCLAIIIAVVMLSSFCVIPAYALERDNAPVAYRGDWSDVSDDSRLSPSSSADTYNLTVNGEYFTADKLTISCGDGTATFDPNTSTLTLNHAELSKTPSTGNFYRHAAIGSAISDLTVVFKGKTVYDEGKSDNYFLCSSGKVTFTGDGTAEMYKTESVEHEEYIEEEYRWETYYTYESLQTNVKMEINADVAFDHVKADRFFITNTKTGNLTVSNSTLTRCDLTVPGSAAIEKATMQGEQYTAKHSDTINYYRSSVYCKSLTVRESTLALTDISVQDDVSLNNVKLDYASVQTGGSLTVQKLASFCKERTQTEYQNEVCVLNASRLNISGKSDLKYTNITGWNTFEISGATLESCELNAGKDLNMDSCTFYGTDMRIQGNFTCKKSVGNAKYEGQNSGINVYGSKVTVTDCDFKGIAKTNQGEEEVYIPGAMGAAAMTKVFYYETYTGVWLYLESENDPTAEAEFINSKIIMNKMSVYNPNLKLRIIDTVFMLCNSDFGCPDEYNYDENITLSGNIGIVTGFWGGDYRSGGVFIDILGGYFTFDEKTGVLCLNNDYGVQGWLQRTEYGYSGSFIEKNTEIIEKVKKVVIGKDVTYTEYDQWFSGYKNLTEIDFGDSAEWVGHGYPNCIFRGCENLESVTIGSNVKYIYGSGSSGMPLFGDCKNLKTLTIKSEQINDDCFRGMQKDWFGDAYHPDLIIYVPLSQVERFKQALPAYKDQIIGVDFPKEAILLGDVDGDSFVTILDATAIQRYVADLTTNTFIEAAADADGDGDVTILDATSIQRWLADLPTNKGIGEPIS